MASSASSSGPGSPVQEWRQVNKKNKKRTRTSPDNNSFIKRRQSTIKDYWLSEISTENSFSPLEKENKNLSEETVSNTNRSEEINITIKKPPPIFVCKVQNIKPLKEHLDNVAKGSYSLRLTAVDQVKVQLFTPELYLPVVESLKNKKTEFYTYQRKQDKPFKVVLRNLHHSTDISLIKEEIEALGHKVVQIYNIKQNVTKFPLPLFSVEIVSDSTNKNIYNINKLLNCIVSFEPPYKKREIPQCYNCQGFGHTKKYCYKTPNCVKCAKSHKTSDCPLKEKVKEVICANCSGNHPASYKGCPARKALQQRLFPTLREKGAVTDQENQSTTNRNIPTSYAQAAGNLNTTESNNNNNNYDAFTIAINKLQETMGQMLSRMDSLFQLLTNVINTLLSKNGN